MLGAIHEAMVPRACRKCGGAMHPSKALMPAGLVPMLRPGEQPAIRNQDYIYTTNSTGMVDCLKCERCGWSITKGEGP